MRSSRSGLVLGFVALGALAGCSRAFELSEAAAAEPAVTAQVARKVLERAPITGSDDELRLMLIEYPPGVAGPPHRHPVTGLCYVIEGTAESQYEGELLKTFRAGDSYRDPAGKPHRIFRNASATQPLRFTCSAKIGKNQEFVEAL
ncbi:MAG TPA: cupin domain-containing protein [Polyangiaceae bacterium]|nr:cupin domain-containing protein [Polyangiaceae bacterium]